MNKAVLIPLLTLTLLIPFGVDSVSQSHATDEMTNHTEQRLLDLFNKGNIIQYKIDKQLNKASMAETDEQRDYHLAKVDKLKGKMVNIVQKINKLAPLTENITGTTETLNQQEQGATGQSGTYTIVATSERGCDGDRQYYIAKMRINTPSDTTRWNIDYENPISIGLNPICWDTSFVTYEIIIHNHSGGWTCAANNIVGSTSIFEQTCSNKTINDDDFLHISTIAHYANWQIEKSDFLRI